MHCWGLPDVQEIAINLDKVVSTAPVCRIIYQSRYSRDIIFYEVKMLEKYPRVEIEIIQLGKSKLVSSITWKPGFFNG